MTFAQRLGEVRTGFERPFWVANVSELFERLSYYAAFASLAPGTPAICSSINVNNRFWISTIISNISPQYFIAFSTASCVTL